MSTSIKPASPNVTLPASVVGNGPDSFAPACGLPRPGIGTGNGQVFPSNDHVIDPGPDIPVITEAPRSGPKQSAHQATQTVGEAHS